MFFYELLPLITCVQSFAFKSLKLCHLSPALLTSKLTYNFKFIARSYNYNIHRIVGWEMLNHLLLITSFFHVKNLFDFIKHKFNKQFINQQKFQLTLNFSIKKNTQAESLLDNFVLFQLSLRCQHKKQTWSHVIAQSTMHQGNVWVGVCVGLKKVNSFTRNRVRVGVSIENWDAPRKKQPPFSCIGIIHVCSETERERDPLIKAHARI